MIGIFVGGGMLGERVAASPTLLTVRLGFVPETLG